MDRKFPKRKHPRLKEYDYSENGACFVTICTYNRRCILSHVVISDVVCAYKSLTTRKCKEIGRIDKVFQTSFHDHIIRNQADYDDRYRYIENNPLQWELDELYIQ